MFPAASLLTASLLTLSIAATPGRIRNSLVTLPMAKRINSNGGTVNLVVHDQARAAALKEHGAALRSGNLDRRQSIDVANDVVSYIAAVAVGNPPTTYNLIVDTGSSNTWVGAGTAYAPTSSGQDTGEPVSVTYGSGYFFGEEWLDTVSLGSGLTISQQSIGVASTSSGFSGVDGILGIGPEILTEGTLTDEPSTVIPTVTRNLYSQGEIAEEVVSVFFAPTTSDSDENGELAFGGVDASKYTGTLSYTPLTTTYPVAYYWGINESITYGGKTILAEAAGIVDTGTTLILLVSKAYSAYQSATGATRDRDTGLLKFTSGQYDALENLDFNIGSVTYGLTPNGQIWPRSLNTYIGGASGSIYGIVNDLGSEEGLEFINGLTFLERFYSVFDTTHSQVGFATTAYTDATTN